MAAARNLWWKLLLIVMVMAVLQFGLLLWGMEQHDLQIQEYIDQGHIFDEEEGNNRPAFDNLAEDSHIGMVFAAAVLALTACCCIQGSRFSEKNLYTLQRMPLGEWQIGCCWTAVHFCCFLILWAAEIAVIFGLWRYYAWVYGPLSPGFELLTSIYDRAFLRTILPLQDIGRWFFLLSFLAAAPMVTTVFGFFQRRGKYHVFPAVALMGSWVFMSLMTDACSPTAVLLFGFLCLLTAGIEIWRMGSEIHDVHQN